MKTFKQFTELQEAARSKGEEMEQVIVAAWNGEAYEPGKGIPADAGAKVIEYLKSQGLSGKAEVLGQDQMEVTKDWSQYWAPDNVPPSTKTPKTDFVIGNHKISLKSGGSAQLMSGGRNESRATFYAAMNQLDGVQKKLLADVSSMFENLAPASVAAGGLRGEIKKAKDEAVNRADKAHKELMGKLRDYFAKSPQFAYNFTYEAMSGEAKFGGNLGTCSHFLSVGFDGGNAKLHPVNDTAYVNSIAKQMKVSVRFKTTSEKTTVDGKTTKTGRYRYWSVVGLIVDKLGEELEQYNDDELLTEGVLTNISNAVKDFFARVWRKIVEFISRSWKNFMEFMQVEPEISANTVVNV